MLPFCKRYKAQPKNCHSIKAKKCAVRVRHGIHGIQVNGHFSSSLKLVLQYLKTMWAGKIRPRTTGKEKVGGNRTKHYIRNLYSYLDAPDESATKHYMRRCLHLWFIRSEVSSRSRRTYCIVLLLVLPPTTPGDCPARCAPLAYSRTALAHCLVNCLCHLPAVLCQSPKGWIYG